MAYAVESGRASSNPCREVKRPRKTRRERLITNEEYIAVYSSAGAAVRRAMALAVRTLALPADILALGPRNILWRPNGERVLRFSRGKTRVVVEIEIVGELAKIIDECLAASVVRSAFVHREDGQPYTTDGLTSMFRRHCIAAKVRDFGLLDLRAKGATDEYRAGRPIREQQNLLGHKSVRTTEIYLKELIPETVRPNERPMIAGSK
jgi:integrase